MFYGCRSIVFLPDISNWNISNVTDISGIFSNCRDLVSLPDISKKNTAIVIKMSNLFSFCNEHIIESKKRYNNKLKLYM